MSSVSNYFTGRHCSSKPSLLLLNAVAVIVISVFVATALVSEGRAGGKRIYFSGSSKKIVSGAGRSNTRYHYNQKSSRYKPITEKSGKIIHLASPSSLYPALKYNGPLVIDIHAALARKRLKIITGSSQTPPPGTSRHVIGDGPGGPRVIYYSDSQCDGGYDCIIRLGNSPSSPKIIVIGEKRKAEDSGPRIIYPPS